MFSLQGLLQIEPNVNFNENAKLIFAATVKNYFVAHTQMYTRSFPRTINSILNVVMASAELKVAINVKSDSGDKFII
jgi:hypothetical protein